LAIAQSKNMMRSFKQFLIIATIFITSLLILIEIWIVIFPNIPPFPVHMLTYRFYFADTISAEKLETKYIYSGIDDEIKEMRNILSSSLSGIKSKRDFDSAKEILKSILSGVSFGQTEIKSKTPLGKFKEVKAGKSGLCFDFNHIYSGFLQAAGYKSRIVILQSNLLLQHGYNHTNVEVFIPEYHKWIVIDPSFGCYFSLNDVPMSAIEINRLLQRNLEQINDIKINYIQHKGNLPKWNKYLFLMYNNVILVEKYLLPVIKYESVLTDFKNIISHCTVVYIYSDEKEKNLLCVLNAGNILVKIIFPVVIILNCVVLSVVFLKKICKKKKID